MWIYNKYMYKGYLFIIFIIRSNIAERINEIFRNLFLPPFFIIICTKIYIYKKKKKKEKREKYWIPSCTVYHTWQYHFAQRSSARPIIYPQRSYPATLEQQRAENLISRNTGTRQSDITARNYSCWGEERGVSKSWDSKVG